MRHLYNDNDKQMHYTSHSIVTRLKECTSNIKYNKKLQF